MVVHMLRYICDETAGPPLIDEGITTFLEKRQEWSGGGPNETPTLYDPIPDDPPEMVSHYHAEWRFEWSEDRADMTTQLTNLSEQHAEWYQIAYHICDHNHRTQYGCPWETTIEGGEIPAGAPTVTPASDGAESDSGEDDETDVGGV